jgi:hypothetical protein
MKTLAAIAMAGLTTFGAVGSAAAFSFSPPDTPLKLRGTLTITGPQGAFQCEVVWRGTSGHPRPQLFQAISDCRYNPTSLPWRLRATALNKATILDFAFVPIPGQDALGPCGPGDLFAKVSSTGVWSFKNSPLPGGCTINGSLTSDPPVTIVP